MSELDLTALRQTIADCKHASEQDVVAELIAEPAFDSALAERIEQAATALIEQCRGDTKSQTLLDAFLQEYGLSNQEGVALMCLAEALLRVPDALTADRLIAEKLADGDWFKHLGSSTSWLVNAATWGLVLTGKLVALDTRISQQPRQWWRNLVTRLSAPVVRTAVLQAMRLMGGQYVLGRDIDEGVKRGYKQNRRDDLRFSFDMLGEGARTHADAERYYQSYSDAFDRVGALNDSNSVISSHGVSVKLSALHPHYHFAHYDTVMLEMLPKVTALCIKAKRYNIGISIDAEEAARLEMSLDIFQALCENPELAGWRGLGFVLQAYQKRAPAVARWLVALAAANQRTIMVRLVKGAYWDAEIKLAQEQGYVDYPVFTRKVNTDVCYLHCAKVLLEANGHVFAQFATHNAHTAVAISQLADRLEVHNYEFQRLHGMGELLYKHLPQLSDTRAIPLRVYAPIGQHRDLLPYLVRRLLENGANSSFVNRFLDTQTLPQSLVRDCYQEARRGTQFRHSGIPTPNNIFISERSQRLNAAGFDLDDATTVSALQRSIDKVASQELVGHSIVGGEPVLGIAEMSTNPSLSAQAAGTVHTIDEARIQAALENAYQASAEWNDLGAHARTAILNKMADVLEQNSHELIGLISREAGRTLADCVSEVREAVDFCRYYGEQALLKQRLPAQGVFLCISPWNFPLAIFTGQISAALAAGNSVLAKPADPTPIIATKVTQLFHQAGVPHNTLQLLIGDGSSIGAQLLPDPRLAGVAFTGSTEVAKLIHRQLSERPGPSIPFIAETGGQNCMIVDSTALPEQVVDDVISSAFHSAGQRCSALRVLYLQDVIADTVMHMLEGALSTVRVGLPRDLATEVGPIIDDRARTKLQEHADYIAPLAHRCLKGDPGAHADEGTFFTPRVYEINSIKLLPREVFGPILHVIRYNMSELEQVIDDINNTGYGLTFGVHSRINAFAERLFDRTHAGNTYINRNTIGAVVGVNPFGGRGLSGTGPKAGGPSYLLRFQRAASNGTLQKTDDAIVAVESHRPLVMPGPTGELNVLSRVALGNVLFVLDEQTPLKPLVHLCCLTLALGNNITFTVRNMANRAQLDALLLDIPSHLHAHIGFNEENVLARVSNPAHAAIAIHRSHPALEEFKVRVAKREGPIITLVDFDDDVLLAENLEWYLSQLSSERTKTDNLVAKGGNTHLFNLDEG